MRQLLVFAKDHRPGFAKSRLAAAVGPAAAAALYRAFLEDTAAQLRRGPAADILWWVDGDPLVLGEAIGPGWSVEKQKGRDLGARLEAALAGAFERGPGPVAVIGGDCPLLRADDLEALFGAVEGGADAAVIPAEDGGYVALALGKPFPEAFRGIPWSTAEALAATLAAFQSAGRAVRVLPSRYDVDEFRDLARLAKDLRRERAAAPATARALETLGLAGLGEEGTAPVVDALGRSIPVVPRPRRILSLVPSVTECLFDAGLGDRVVGRTDYCISPAEARRLPSVGGPRTLDVEGAVALAPDLVLANAEENDRQGVEALIGRGLRVHVAFPKKVADVAAHLRDLGRLTACPAAFEKLAKELLSVPPPPGPPVPAACLIWKDPFMTAAGDTLTSALLEAAGAANVFAGLSPRYPRVTQEALADAGARVILLPSEPYEFTEADASEIEASAPGSRAVRVPGEWVTWYGSRMVEAIEGLRAAMAPYRTGDPVPASRREPQASH